MSTVTSSSSNYRPCGSPTPMVTFNVPMRFLIGLSRLIACRRGGSLRGVVAAPVLRVLRRLSIEVLHELVVDGFRRNADRVVPVGDLSPGLQVPVLFECLGDSVQVDHHLNDVAGVLLSSLHVDDDVDVEAANFPVGDAFVEERGVVEHPLGLVGLGRGSGPVPVVSLEPGGPLARVFAGQQPGQPGGLDVGRLSGNGQDGTRGMGIHPLSIQAVCRAAALCCQSFSEAQSARTSCSCLPFILFLFLFAVSACYGSYAL